MREFLIFLGGVLFGGIVGIITMGLCNAAKIWSLNENDLYNEDTKKED